MGSFMKYLDSMEKDFSGKSVKKKEQYIDEIDESNVYVEEEVDDVQEYVETESQDISIYKRRMVNELFNLGLSKPKINAVIQNVFADEYEEDMVVEYEEPQPARRTQTRQPSFKERMMKLKQQRGQQQSRVLGQQGIPSDSKLLKSQADVASDILAGVPLDDPYAAPSEMGGMYGGGGMYPQQPMYQQQYGSPMPQPRQMGHQMPMPQRHMASPPPIPTGPMATINDPNVGAVMASAPGQLLQMPEGFENFKPENADIPINAQVQKAAGILAEPVGGSVCTKPARIAPPKQGETHQVAFQPQEQVNASNNANAILEQPSNEHIGGAPMQQPQGGAADHASQLLM